MTEPCDLSAIEARRLIGTKALSPVELMRSCLQRIEEVNPRLNAIVALDAAEGIAGAKRAEEAVMAGEELELLHGLPVGIKDLEETGGLRTTHGSLLFKDHVPAEDEASVARVRAAGGIIFAKTNTPEFGAGANTFNRVYGATGNPFAPDLTCAGSSGGSAVALATGMMPLATGSDMGGSLRTPAAFCGVVGFRPSPGIVPDALSSPSLAPFSVLGPMARTVEDAHLLLKAQIAIDRRDPYSSLDALDIPERLSGADLSSMRVAISEDLGAAPVDNGIRRIFRARTGLFRHVFREAVDRNPEMAGIHETFEVLRAIGFVVAYAEPLASKRDLLGPNVIDNTERGLEYSLADVARAHLVQTGLYRKFLDLFDDIDILICPAAAVSPFPHKERYVTHINGVEMDSYTRWLALSYCVTMMLGTSCCIPCGRDEKGLPFGIQVVGPKGSDALVLETALAIEGELATRSDTARALPSLAALAS